MFVCKVSVHWLVDGSALQPQLCSQVPAAPALQLQLCSQLLEEADKLAHLGAGSWVVIQAALQHPLQPLVALGVLQPRHVEVGAAQTLSDRDSERVHVSLAGYLGSSSSGGSDRAGDDEGEGCQHQRWGSLRVGARWLGKCGEWAKRLWVPTILNP